MPIDTSNKVIVMVYLALLIMVQWIGIFAAPSTGQLRLVDDLLSGYNPSLIPLIHPRNGPLPVSVAFMLNRVQKLEERTQTLKSLGYITMTWKDELLEWDPDKYDGIESIVLKPDDIWLPDIQVLNSVNQPEEIALSETMRFRPSVSHTGEVTWSPGQQWVTFCAMDLIFFPFDTQICNISLINMVNGRQGNVKLQLKTEKVLSPSSAGPTTGEWSLTKASASLAQLKLQNSADLNDTTQTVFNVVTLTLELTRESIFYVYNVVVPIVIITQISTLVYLIPCESGEKISFSITLLLAYFVMLLMVSDLMPRAGSTVPYITTYIVLCMFINSLSLFWTIIILILYHHHPYTRVPSCVRGFFFGCCSCLTKAKYIKRKHSSPEDFYNRTLDPSDRINKTKVQLDQETLDRNKQEWEEVARALDRFFFICSVLFITALTVVYFIVVKVAALTYTEFMDTITNFDIFSTS